MARVRGIDMLGVEVLATRPEAVANPALLSRPAFSHRSTVLRGAAERERIRRRGSVPVTGSAWHQALAGAECSLLRAVAGQQGGGRWMC